MKSKKLLWINFLFSLCVFPFFLGGCGGTVKEKVVYDRNIKTFKFFLPPKKASLGLLYFSDSRSDFDKLGESFLPKKRSLRDFSTKLAEELLLQNNTFSSVTIIAPFELPDLTNQQEIDKFQKSKDIDYIFAGDILEAKIVKEERKALPKKAFINFFNIGRLPEDFIYVGKARVRGKLYSVNERKVVWQGEGRSNFLPTSRYATPEIIFVGALHNAIGSMLKDMSGIFSIKVKEIE